jgi:hypothetical protein
MQDEGGGAGGAAWHRKAGGPAVPLTLLRCSTTAASRAASWSLTCLGGGMLAIWFMAIWGE